MKAREIQADLPGMTRPGGTELIEVGGHELKALLDKLDAEGRIVFSLSPHCIGRWRLVVGVAPAGTAR
jgi:hypothetical protein